MNYSIPLYKLSLIRDGSVCAERKIVTKSDDLYPILREYYANHDRGTELERAGGEIIELSRSEWKELQAA